MANYRVIYSSEAAELLGLTVGALHKHIKRRTGVVPPPFRMGRQYAWRLSDIEVFLAKKAETASRHIGTTTKAERI